MLFITFFRKLFLRNPTKPFWLKFCHVDIFWKREKNFELQKVKKIFSFFSFGDKVKTKNEQKEKKYFKMFLKRVSSEENNLNNAQTKRWSYAWNQISWFSSICLIWSTRSWRFNGLESSSAFQWKGFINDLKTIQRYSWNGNCWR